METVEAYDEMLRVVDSCAARIGWRLRPHSKRRLLTDILLLCTGMRAVILVDYGGIIPKLQDNLCNMLHHAQQETSIVKLLRVMIIQDMVYLIHIKGLAEHASQNIRSQHQLAFVDLENSPCKLLSEIEDSELAKELVSIQGLFSAAFPVEVDVDLLPVMQPASVQQKLECSARDVVVDCINDYTIGKTSELVDLSAFLQDARVAIPSLNGWLLGYPVTYLLSNKNAEKATSNLALHSLNIYKVFICRKDKGCLRQSEDELMSFSVPCDLIPRRDKEPWAETILTNLRKKLERCNHVWGSVRLEVEFIPSHSYGIVL